MLRLLNSLQCKQVETSKSSCWCLVLCVLQAVYVHVVIWWMKYISLHWNKYTQQNSQCITSSQARPADKLKRCVEDNLGEIESGHPFWESRKWNFLFVDSIWAELFRCPIDIEAVTVRDSGYYCGQGMDLIIKLHCRHPAVDQLLLSSTLCILSPAYRFHIEIKPFLLNFRPCCKFSSHMVKKRMQMDQ